MESVVNRLPYCVCLATTLVCPTATADWPQFRGPTGQGHANVASLPIKWSETENIRWKITIPGKGWSSPVIAGDQIWLTSALDEGRVMRAICVNRTVGVIAHNVELFQREQADPVHPQNSYASPTPVVRDGRVYVHFGHVGTACLTTGGDVVWKNQSLEFVQPYSGGSSPVLFDELLIINCDGTDAQFVVALDSQTGDVVWQQQRLHVVGATRKAASEPDLPQGFPLMAYATPLVTDVDGTPQLVSPAANHVAAYDPYTGKEIWWCGYEGFSIVARPVTGHGCVYVCGLEGETRVLLAIRQNARGEVTQEELVWKLPHGGPLVPSPLVVGDLMFLCNDRGVAICLDAKTGDEHWKKRIGGNYSASPTCAADAVYLVSEEGKTTVLATDKQPRVLAVNQLDGQFMASPAVVGSTLYLRSATHLYAIEEGDVSIDRVRKVTPGE
jgi:outer membrane protein assembly factor BamB